MAESDACVTDLINTLRNYEQGLSDVLSDGVELAEELSAERAGVLLGTEVRAVTKASAEDGLRVEEGQARYLGALAVEHNNWFKRESEVADAGVAARKYELEIVGKHLAEQGRSGLQEALHERCERHLRFLTPGVQATSSENRFIQAETARQEWTTEVCKAVIMEMRKEWRLGQRKVLQQLAGELRAERKAAGDALERQINMSRKVSETVKEMWVNEIQRAQEELDQVSEVYKRALKYALEAKLREARQHAKEQAEFFQKEIREALLFEQQEHAAHRAQLRRMRLAMLKWRFDYTADAKKKAQEIVARGTLAKLAALGLGQDDVVPEDEAKKQKKQIEKGIEKQTGANAKLELNDQPVRQGSSARFAEEDVEEESEVASDVSSDVSIPPTPEDWVPDRDLSDCRAVQEKLWSRFATGEETAIEFMFKLEELVPYEDEILLMYEEELQRHGVVVALDATDGRAEEALQAEREAAASKSQDTKEEVTTQQHRRRKGVKPAVPTVKRRVNLMQ